MAENQKKQAIEEVLTQTKASRGALGLEEGGTKSSDLSSTLSDAWQSPAAEDVETAISTTVSGIGTEWSSIETQVQSDYDKEPDDVDSESLEARWFTRSPRPS